MHGEHEILRFPVLDGYVPEMPEVELIWRLILLKKLCLLLFVSYRILFRCISKNHLIVVFLHNFIQLISLMLKQSKFSAEGFLLSLQIFISYVKLSILSLRFLQLLLDRSYQSLVAQIWWFLVWLIHTYFLGGWLVNLFWLAVVTVMEVPWKTKCIFQLLYLILQFVNSEIQFPNNSFRKMRSLS